MIVPVMAISNLVLTRQIYSEETNGTHAHYRVFQVAEVLTVFRTESLVWISERRLMVPVSGLKRVLSKAYIGLGWPVVLRCYCGLVDHG